jgi:hypothetical protein
VRKAARIVRYRRGPAVWLWTMAAMALPPWSTLPAQQPGDIRQQVFEAVQHGNESELLELIRKPAGRQELLGLSDSFVFEIRAARMLAASLPQSPEDRKAVRQTELSLLHQTDEESVAQELFVGLLALESREVTDPSVAIKLADALYDDIHKDLNDHVVIDGKVVSEGKSRAILKIAESIVKTRPNPVPEAFLKQILARAMPPDPPAGAPAPQAPASINTLAPQNRSASEAVGKGILIWVGLLLIVLLVAAIGWRMQFHGFSHRRR